MVQNSGERLRDYLVRNPDAKAEWEEKRKLRDDPRVTGSAPFCEKSLLMSGDQLFNVLKGEMSIVGPLDP